MPGRERLGRSFEADPREAGFEEEARGIFEMLEDTLKLVDRVECQEEAREAQPLSAFMLPRELRKLEKTMMRMSFSNLMCFVSHQSTLSAQRLDEALEVLRWQLTRC